MIILLHLFFNLKGVILDAYTKLQTAERGGIANFDNID